MQNFLFLKAKDDYERNERKKEQAKSRGEGTWMLPSLDERIERENRVTSLHNIQLNTQFHFIFGSVLTTSCTIHCTLVCLHFDLDLASLNPCSDACLISVTLNTTLQNHY